VLRAAPAHARLLGAAKRRPGAWSGSGFRIR
jgi:hypothetical protein